MTYCVGALLEDGLVLASDSRTNAGVDYISTFCKMVMFEVPGERVLVLMSAGNLATTQSVVALIGERLDDEGARFSIYDAPTMFKAAEIIGNALREVMTRDAEHVRAGDGDPCAGMRMAPKRLWIQACAGIPPA